MLRLSRFFLWFSEFWSDVEEYDQGFLTWRRIRARRKLPPSSEWADRPDTSRAAFRLPPDIERPSNSLMGGDREGA